MSMSFGRASRLASSNPRDFEFEFFVFQNEARYANWWSWKRLSAWFRTIPDNTLWNSALALMIVAGLVSVATDLPLLSRVANILDYIYNAIYAMHTMAMFYEYRHSEYIKKTASKRWGLVFDLLSFLHYFSRVKRLQTSSIMPWSLYVFRISMYYLRLHRPFRYMWALTDSNLKGSVIGTFFKYQYIFIVARVTFSLYTMTFDLYKKGMESEQIDVSKWNTPQDLYSSRLGCFLVYAYTINKLFYPIGTESDIIEDNLERVAFLIMTVVGCLLVSGAAVASLSLVITMYMRPEETFRARFRLIMDDMEHTKIPQSLSDKVDTFYRMYWHKQRGVSVTQLLPLFPPTLPASIYTDIYFEAQQKSPILRDLSYQFLWEISKVMSTVHFIPGDAIIKRNSTKSSIVYITYGDVEMLTAEDDDTPILRMTRGSIVSPCAGCVPAACVPALVQIRAATFCTAHVLTAGDLWRVASKHGRINGQSFILLSSFEEHLEKVKKHYQQRVKLNVKYKSSIMQFKRNLIELKGARDDSGNLLLARPDYFLLVSDSYLMRNRADTSLTEQSDEICLRPTFPCILQPQSSLLFVWHLLMAILIAIVVFVHPYHIVFKPKVELEFRFFDYMMSLFFAMDLLVHLSTGDNVEEGVPITFMQTSSQQMMNKWFVADVVAVLPLFELVGDGRFGGINKLIRLTKVFRVLKSMEELVVYHSNVLRFLSYSFMLLIVCYLVASTHHAYQCFVAHKCNVKNFTHPPFWVSDKPEAVQEHHILDNIMFNIYFAISLVTFTGHKAGPMKSESVKYLLVTTIFLEFCAILHIFIEAVYSATITVTTSMESDYDACIENVKNFLIRNNMDPKLRHRFITYLQLCWFTDKAYAITHQKRSVLYDLPAHVYQDIVARQRNKYILKLPFLQYLNKETLKEISAHSRIFYTSPNEILMNTGDVNNEIYIITKGFCEVFDPDTKEVVDLISENKYFGVLECLMRCPAYYTVRAVTHVQIISISRKHLMKTLHMRKLRNAIVHVKAQPEFKGLNIRREPFLEYEQPPEPPSRYRFPLPRKHIPDSAFMYPFNRLGFFSVLRYVFPRFTIRPDGKYMMRYELFRSVCALCSAMLFPSYTYLVLQWPALYYVTFALDIAAYFDMIQRTLVGFFNEDGILVSHPASTAAHYLKGAFLVDLLACIPLEFFEFSYGEDHDWYFSDTPIHRREKYTAMEVQQFLMLNRLVQLYRIVNALEFLSNYIQRRDVILAIKAIPLTMVVVNVVTCLLVIHSTEIYGDAKSQWVIIPFRAYDQRNTSWVILFKDALGFNITESPWNLHLTVYFWVVYECITTGYGVINPNNLDQMCIIIFGMFTSAMISEYFSVVIISVRSTVNYVLASYQENTKDIVTFMRRERLNMDLQKELLNYYEYNWDKMGGLDYREVLKLCDQITLRTDAILHIYGHTFERCPILLNCDISLLRVLGRAVYSQYFLKGTVIVEKDDIIEDLYIIDFGTVEMVDLRGAYRAVTKLSKGSVFGHLDKVPTTRCPTSFVATNDLHLLKINSTMFHTVIADFPTVKVLMKKCRPKNENFIVSTSEESTSTATGVKKKEKHSKPLYALITITNADGGWVRHLYLKSKVAETYLIIVSLLTVYADVYNAGFQNNNEELVMILYALDILFAIKIIVYMVMPLIIEEGPVQYNFVETRAKYIKGELRYDILSLLPIELLAMLYEDHGRKFSLLRLNRLLRIVTVYKALERHNERLSINLVLSTMLTVSIWFSVFVHCASCIWYSIGEYEELRSANSSWLVTNSVDANLTSYPMCYKSYLCSIYFLLTTFTEAGTSEIIPKQHSEVIFTITLQLTSSLIFMVYVGEFSSIIQYQSFRSFNYYSQYLELQEFLKNNRVSRNLVKLVNRYSLHLWRETRGRQLPHFLDCAPQTFRLKLMSAVYLKHLEGHIYFKFCEPAFLRQLVGCLKLYTYCEGVSIVKESEITDAMYLIHTGKVQEFDEDMGEDGQRGQIFTEGQYFGLSQGLVRDIPYTYSYRTLAESQVLTLQLDSWEYLLQHFPKSRYAIYRNVPGHHYGMPPGGRQKRDSDDYYNEIPEEEYTQRQARRSTIYGSYLPFTLPTAGPPPDAISMISTFGTGSDTSLHSSDEESTETIQQAGEEVAKPEQKPAEKATTDEERGLKRRKTLLQKIAQKMKSGDKAPTEKEEKIQPPSSAEGTPFASKLNIEDDTSYFIREESAEVAAKATKPGLQFHPGVEIEEIEARTKDKDDESGAPRMPRLSFLPGLVQEGGIPSAAKSARRSILPGLEARKIKHDDETFSVMPDVTPSTSRGPGTQKAHKPTHHKFQKAKAKPFKIDDGDRKSMVSLPDLEGTSSEKVRTMSRKSEGPEDTISMFSFRLSLDEDIDDLPPVEESQFPIVRPLRLKSTVSSTMPEHAEKSDSSDTEKPDKPDKDKPNKEKTS